MTDARIIDRNARIVELRPRSHWTHTPTMEATTSSSAPGGSDRSIATDERSPPPGDDLRTGGTAVARNARAHTEDLVAADPEIGAEYEAFRLRRAVVGQLRAVRERKRWTQQQLADAVGVPRSAMARLESAGHSPRLETLHAVARELGYEVDVRLKRRRIPVA